MKRHRFTNIRGHAVVTDSDSGGKYQSALERDNFVVTLMNPKVRRVRLQWPKVKFIDENGSPHRYTADAEVDFHPGVKRRRLAVECKYVKELQSDPTLEKKFTAVRAAMEAAGYDFEVRTELDIHTADFPHKRFIFDYRNHEAHAKSGELLAYVGSRPGVRLGDVIRALGDDWISQLEIVAEVWRLVARHEFAVDFGARFSRDTMLRRTATPCG